MSSKQFFCFINTCLTENLDRLLRSALLSFVVVVLVLVCLFVYVFDAFGFCYLIFFEIKFF